MLVVTQIIWYGKFERFDKKRSVVISMYVIPPIYTTINTGFLPPTRDKDDVGGTNDPYVEPVLAGRCMVVVKSSGGDC